MEDDGYHTQQRRVVYQQDGRDGRGSRDGGPQRVRIYLPSSPSTSSSSSFSQAPPTSTSTYMDYPQGDNTPGPQVIRILPRAVYNLKHEGNPAVMGRRGSVDTGLAHVISLGRNEAPQVFRVGGQGYPDGGSESSTRVYRINPSYYPADQSGAAQVIRIGPSGRIIPSGPPSQPSSQQYYTQRPQDFDSRQVYDSRNSGPYSPPTMRVFSSGSPYQASNQSRASGAESPRIIAFGSPQPHSGRPPTLQYTVKARQDDGAPEWHGQQDQYPPQPTAVQSPTIIYSSHPGYRTIATTRTANAADQGSGGNDGSDSGIGPDESRFYGPRMHLRDTGRSDSQETFILGTNPENSRRVNIQMTGPSGAAPRRGSVGLIHVFPMRREQVQQAQQPQQQQPQQQQQQQHPYMYKGSVPDPRSPEIPVSHVIRGTVMTSGSDKMGEFDNIIAESIRQFLIQRQKQQQQQQQQQEQQQQQQQPQQYQQQQPGVSSRSISTVEVPYTPRSSNVEISSLHYPIGGGGNDQVAETGSATPDERNLFNKYKFKFDSIGNFSRSNSREDSSGNEGDTGSGNWGKGLNAPIAIFRFNDFDDMVARMMDLRQQSQQSSGDGQKPKLRGYSTDGGSDNVAVQQEGPDSMQRQHLQPRSKGQDERYRSRETLRHKIELFNGNANGLIMSLEQDSDTFHGFIRVQMNLIRPVQMEVQAQPPTLFDVLNPDATVSTTTGEGQADHNSQTDTQTTFFYLPKDTTKVIHINSDTTTKEVICSLLSKYKIKDNPRKFALYHKQGTDDETATMRRLNDDETPLPMCLSWTDEGIDGLAKNKFVLQENDTGEILWDAFSLPELENFLLFLNREEEEYIKEMKTTYRLLKIQLQKRSTELEGNSLKQINDKQNEQ